ncbi:MAG: SapC family protein [Rhodoferax sp.]|nr:SapC family protein [Rhodoferax sp.]
MSSLNLYQNITVLDRKLHAQLKLQPLSTFGFAAQLTVVPVLAQEFFAVAREYTIAFLRNPDGSVTPVVLTGAPDGRNLYVNGNGAWTARYLPAFVRRYPFIFAETGPGQLTLCFDQACANLNHLNGNPLFDETGQATQTVQGVLEFLSGYQRAAAATQQFAQRLDAAGLLMDAQADAVLADGRNQKVLGFLVVDEARFRQLPEAMLTAWFASGELGLVYAHLLSLGHFVDLLSRPSDKTAVSEASSSAVAETPAPALAAATTGRKSRPKN